MGPALESGADGAVLAGNCARADDAGGTALRAGVPAAARASVGSRRWTAAALSHRAGAADRQLHLAIGGAGVCERAAGRHGQRGNPARQAAPAPRAWTGAGPSQGIRATDAGAAAARSAAGEPRERVPGASRGGGAVVFPARAGARAGPGDPGVWTGQPGGAAAAAARGPAWSGSVTSRHAGSLSARRRAARRITGRSADP